MQCLQERLKHMHFLNNQLGSAEENTTRIHTVLSLYVRKQIMNSKFLSFIYHSIIESKNKLNYDIWS